MDVFAEHIDERKTLIVLTETFAYAALIYEAFSHYLLVRVADLVFFPRKIKRADCDKEKSVVCIHVLILTYMQLNI